MNMRFERHKVQSRIEHYIGCNNPEELKNYKTDFKNISLSSDKVNDLIEDLKSDSKNCFFKALYSLCEALSNVEKGNYSWSIVKIYYSSFYFIRCILAIENYSIIKCRGVFILKLDIGEKPYQLDGRGGEHPQIIAKYKQLIGSKDPLLSNTIEGDGNTYIYDYLKEMREIVHYREPFFREPKNDFFENFSDLDEFREKVKYYFNDETMEFCFQKPYCLLSAPMFLLNHTNKALSNFLNKETILDEEQSTAIRKLILPLGLERLFEENKLITRHNRQNDN